jgi:hypothetical protein
MVARDGWNDRRANSTETTMFAKTLALALVLAGASLSFIGNVSAAPVRAGWQPTPSYTFDRFDPTPLWMRDRSDPTK